MRSAASTQVKIISPKLPPQLDVADAHKIEGLTDDSSCEASIFQDAMFMGVQADSVSFDETRLERAIFTDARLQRLSFRDSLLTSCDFSMVRSAHGSWHRVVIQKGRMTGWDTSASVLQDVHFKHCKLDLINMRFSKLTRVLFEDCVLTGADFSNATLVQVVFDGCQLDQAEFSQVSLEKVDMRGSELIGLRGWRFLKGAIIDDVQLQSIAPYLAAEIGLQVKE